MVTTVPRACGSAAIPIRALPALRDGEFHEIRRHLVLNCCKWDPQVGDASTLAPFPLALSRQTWAHLATWAERMTNEALEAEQELLRRPDLHRHLGIPSALRRVLRRTTRADPLPPTARVIRFDFHWTSEGWRISEANADVPGGFTEASSFAALMAQRYPQVMPAGDPAQQWSDAIVGAAGDAGGTVALLVAAGYMEDHQVVAYLAARIREQGLRALVCSPAQLSWCAGRARLNSAQHGARIDAVVRFYQAEWLAEHNQRAAWHPLFSQTQTPVLNPTSAVLLETKRFPLVWRHLQTALPTWRRLLPETHDPRDVPWQREDEWALKAALSNTGDEVVIRPVPADQWRKAARSVWWGPQRWIAQRRFETVAIRTPWGSLRPCIGVYTINGRAAGIYGRLSRGAVTDYSAIDVAVLVEQEEAHA